MLTKIILLYLFIRSSLGCASITRRGIPYIPLHICLEYWFATDAYGYFQIICDSAETGTLFSMHQTSDCSDPAVALHPNILDDDNAVICDSRDCSHAVYKMYNDTTDQCLHSTTTPFQEYAFVIDECGYDTYLSYSFFRSCDANAIYYNYDRADTEGLCENAIESTILRIETGCDDDTGNYHQVTQCNYIDYPPDPDTNGGLTTGAIVGIVIAVVVVLLIGVGIAGYYYYKKHYVPKKDYKYSAVNKVKAEEKPPKTIVVTRAQIKQTVGAPPPAFRAQTQQIPQTRTQQTEPPPFRAQTQQTLQTETEQAEPPAFQPQAQQTIEIETIMAAPPAFKPQSQEAPPSPPQAIETAKESEIIPSETLPIPPAFQPEIQSAEEVTIDKEKESLIQTHKSVISDWLQQNAQISEIDANEYANKFIENGFEDLKLLKEITIDELIEIGITKLGHRKAIIKAIQSDEMVLQPIC